MLANRNDDVCPQCDGTGWERAETGVRRCPCWEARHPAAPGLPLWCRSTTRASIPSSAANAGILTRALAWLDVAARPRPDLYLHGPVGTGKTTVAAMLLNELHAQRVPTFFIPVQKLLQAQRNAMDLADLKRDAYDLQCRVCSVDVLVLDDVGGGEKNSDYSRSVLTSVLDDRLAAGHTTLWTSNLDIRRLQDFYGDGRLPSRIVGACDGHIFEFQGEDHRLGRHRRRVALVRPTQLRTTT